MRAGSRKTRRARHKVKRSEASTIQPPIAIWPAWRSVETFEQKQLQVAGSLHNVPPDLSHSEMRALTLKVSGDDPPAVARGRKLDRAATRSLAQLVRRMGDRYARWCGCPDRHQLIVLERYSFRRARVVAV